MVNPEVLASRLARLREYVKYLRMLRRYSAARFSKDPMVRASAERYLHLAIECCLDIGNHLIADRQLRKPEDYREIFLILGEGKLIPPALAKKIAPMGGLRNILVHDYLRVDPHKVHEVLQKRLSDFDRFAASVAKFLR